MLVKMNSNTVRATVFALSAFLFASPAFAISSLEECNQAVKSATQDLLKANVKMDALSAIDAALIAAEGKCVSGDFAGAKADLDNAQALISSAAQN